MKYTTGTVRRILQRAGDFNAKEITQFIRYLRDPEGGCIYFTEVLVAYCADYHLALKPELGEPDPQPGDEPDGGE